jgi:large subunit ribosomal protein L31
VGKSAFGRFFAFRPINFPVLRDIRMYLILLYNRGFSPRQVTGNRVKKQRDRRSADWLPNNLRKIMKENIHPDYREVVFQDMSNDFKFITRSTIQTRETITLDGKEYPLVKLEVTAESHPFYTGKHKIVDTAGRVEKFRQKFGKVGSKTSAAG